MVYVLISIVASLVFYGIIFNKIDSGRCFRFEYIIKTIIIYLLIIVLFLIIFVQIILDFQYFVVLCFIAILVLVFFHMKYTIQRFYDLNLSGWYIWILNMPIISIFVSFYLYFKKGSAEINIYDKAIDYKKLFKDKHLIDIYDNMFFIDNIEYRYEQYLGKYTINISSYEDENFFTKYLINKYPVKQTHISKAIEITKEEYFEMINNLNLIIIKKSFYINIKELEIFIRKEDFKYSIILRKDNKITNEILEKYNIPGLFLEDEVYFYYRKIKKDDLLVWIKNFA